MTLRWEETAGPSTSLRFGRDGKFDGDAGDFAPEFRVQEIAIRMALGSRRVGIVRLILASGAKLALIGCAIGLAGAAAASHLLRSLLFGVSALDPLVLALAALAVMLLALAATLLPARRASSIDPMRALRAD